MSGLCGPGVTKTTQVQVWTWTWNTPPPGYHEESTIWSWRQLGWNPQRRTQRVKRGHVLCLFLYWPWSLVLCSLLVLHFSCFFSLSMHLSLLDKRQPHRLLTHNPYRRQAEWPSRHTRRRGSCAGRFGRRVHYHCFFSAWQDAHRSSIQQSSELCDAVWYLHRLPDGHFDTFGENRDALWSCAFHV